MTFLLLCVCDLFESFESWQVQSWSWDGQEGQPMEVRVFAKCADQKVSLQLNGKEVAGSPMAINRQTQFMASFTVPCVTPRPPSLHIICVDETHVVLTRVLNDTCL